MNITNALDHDIDVVSNITGEVFCFMPGECIDIPADAIGLPELQHGYLLVSDEEREMQPNNVSLVSPGFREVTPYGHVYHVGFIGNEMAHTEYLTDGVLRLEYIRISSFREV